MARDGWDIFTRAYVECMFWSSSQDDGRNFDDGFELSDLSDEAIATIEADCASFQDLYSATLAKWYTEASETPERAGHDFWLTRNRHGAGFWDRWSGGTPQADIGRRLTDAAHAYGSLDLYVGDDGRLYVQ